MYFFPFKCKKITINITIYMRCNKLHSSDWYSNYLQMLLIVSDKKKVMSVKIAIEVGELDLCVRSDILRRTNLIFRHNVCIT